MDEEEVEAEAPKPKPRRRSRVLEALEKQIAEDKERAEEDPLEGLEDAFRRE